MKDRESLFLSLLEKSGATLGIGDDGVEQGGWVYAADAFSEGTHFKREWMSLEALAYKALAVNVSDLYAMNATPLYALLVLGIPPDLSRAEIHALAEGIAKACDTFKVKLIGGDTFASPLLSFAFTLIGKPRKRVLKRRGVRVGDLIFHTGRVGHALRDLRRILRGGRVGKRSPLIRPILFPRLAEEMSAIANAGMDISDGIFFELHRLSCLNRVGFSFLRSIPKEIGCSGEEYVMLFAIPPRHVAKARWIAKRNRVRLQCIARAKRGSYRPLLRGHHG